MCKGKGILTIQVIASCCLFDVTLTLQELFHLVPLSNNSLLSTFTENTLSEKNFLKVTNKHEEPRGKRFVGSLKDS